MFGRGWRKAVAWWLWGVLACVASQPAARASDVGADSATLAGRVVSSVSGLGVSHAQVFLRQVQGNPPKGYYALTDAGGGFVFDRIAPGRYTLFANHPGYVGQQWAGKQARPGGPVLALSPGESRRDLVIRLIPGGALSGRVTAEDGDPLLGAYVAVLRKDWSDGRLQLSTQGGAATNDLGEYRVFGLRPGNYYVAVTYADPGQFGQFYGVEFRGPAPASETYAPTFYPGVLDIAQAQAVNLQAGDDQRGLDLTPLPVRAATIRGRIQKAGGQGEGGLGCVNLIRRDTNLAGFMINRSACPTDAAGDFFISGVLPGAYLLTSSVSDQKRGFSAAVPVDVGEGDVDGLNVVLLPNLDVPGQVNLDGAAPFKLEELQVTLMPVNLAFQPGALSQVNADGTFLLKNVVGGNYHIIAGGPCSSCYVKFASWGGRENTDGRLRVSPDRAGDSLQIVLSTRAAQLEGVVRDDDGKPVPRAFAVLVPDLSRRNLSELFLSTPADDNGQFKFLDVRPGDYQVYAWPQPEDVAYHDPDWLAQFAGRGRNVHLAESGHVQIEVRLLKIPALQSGQQRGSAPPTGWARALTQRAQRTPTTQRGPSCATARKCQPKPREPTPPALACSGISSRDSMGVQ